MSTTLLKLKNAHLDLRKQKNQYAKTIGFHVSEIEKIGKNNGDRRTREEETVQYLKKTVSQLTSDEFGTEESKFEAELLEKFLPPMVSMEEVKTVLEEEGVDTTKQGAVMNFLKRKYGVNVDLKQVSKELF